MTARDEPTGGRRAHPTTQVTDAEAGGHRSVVVTDFAGVTGTDEVAVEEPLTIRIATMAGATADLAVTMRTPGHDDELAVGWLLAEAVISGRRDVVDVAPCALGADDDARGNAIRVTLAAPELPDTSALDRHGLVTSACGVCGRRSVAALAATGIAPVGDTARVPVAVVTALPAALLAAQPTFAVTGGVHAAGVATPDGALRCVREDVGRHNALDKVVGAAVLDGHALAGHVAVLSGRASYELLAKAAAAGLEVVVANGAASSLAVDVAARFGITLVAFAVGPTPRVLTHPHRIVASAPTG
jgi:FdhD protein